MREAGVIFIDVALVACKGDGVRRTPSVIAAAMSVGHSVVELQSRAMAYAELEAGTVVVVNEGHLAALVCKACATKLLRLADIRAVVDERHEVAATLAVGAEQHALGGAAI